MKDVLIAIDQLVNTCVYSSAEGFGEPDETLSARAWRLSVHAPNTWGVFRNAVNLIFFWQEDHCFESYVAEKARKQLPRAYRG